MIKIKYLFFLLIIPFLFIPSVYAQTITQLEFSDRIDYGNGTFTFESKQQRINNGTHWVDYILTENSTTYKIESAQKSMIFHKTGCNAIFYPPGLITMGSQPEISSESSIIHHKNLTANNEWEYIPNVNNAICTNTITEGDGFIQLESNKTNTNEATFSTKYIKNEGNPIKVLLTVVNENPSWTNNTMGFIETIHIPDTITMNGTDYHVPSNNGTFFDHQFFNDTISIPIKLGDVTHYYTDDGINNLWGATLFYIDGQSKITFDYSFNDIPTPVGSAFEIDPTFSGASPTNDGHVSDADNDNTCELVPASFGVTNGSALMDVGVAQTSQVNDCFRTFISWDISSIPNSAIVTDSKFKFDVDSIQGFGPGTCDYISLDENPNSRTLAQIWSDINGGTTMVSADAECDTVGSNKEVDLTSVGDAEIQSKITSGNFFGMGIIQTGDAGMALGGTREYAILSAVEDGTATPPPTLEITYTLGIPDPPTVVTAIANTTDVDIDFNDSISPNVTRYFVQRSTGASWTVVGETPNGTTFFKDLNVPLNTLFNYSVITENGTVIPVNSSASINATVTTNDVPDVPTGLSGQYEGTNKINIQWISPVDIGEGSPTTGLTIVNYTVFAQNFTAGEPFFLSGNTTNVFFNQTSVTFPDRFNFLVKACNEVGCGSNSTVLFIGTPDPPDAVNDLDFYDLEFDSVILNWTEPGLGGGTLQGYQVNFTTPHAEPLTILVADTESSFTEYMVSSLTELTNYSFRVSAINEVGKNATGNILNITTLDDFVEENFTVGEIGEPPDQEVNATNTDVIPIMFERIDVNSTTVMLNITYASNIELACEFGYKFAMTESFFEDPLDEVDIGGGKVETSFLFLDFENEVVDVFCWNEVNNQSASYILVQQNFPLLQQIQSFRDGEYGTDGMFGVLDLITLMVVILSMLGFNRVNETVGALFNLIFIGALSFFEIIELSTTIFSAIALVVMLAIITTRKQ